VNPARILAAMRIISAVDIWDLRFKFGRAAFYRHARRKRSCFWHR